MSCAAFVKSVSNNAGQRYGKDNPIQLAHEKVLVKRLNKKISRIRKEMTKMYQALQDLNNGILSFGSMFI